MPNGEYRDASADTTLDSAVVNTEQTELEQLQKQMSESSLCNIIVQLNELRLDVIELQKSLNRLAKNEPTR